MVSICCVSDSHLGYRHRLKLQRLRDYEKAFVDSMNKVIELKPELFILGGDIFHYPRPDPRSMYIFLKKILEIADSTEIVICIGNHEIEGHLGTAYAPIFSELHKNINVLTTDNPHINLKIDGEEIGVHGFQYIRDRKVAEETLIDISNEVDENCHNILCIHQGIEKYIDPFEISIKTLRDISNKYDLILSGHLHKHQRIEEVFDITPAFYIGSTERISFNEWNNKNGFLVFREFEFNNPEFIEIKSADMGVIRKILGKKTPSEINSYIDTIIRENIDKKCLQIVIEAEIRGDYLDILQDWELRYPEFTILDVNVIPKTYETDIEFTGIEINRRLLEEYFEKTGLKDRKDLMELCIRLYERYS